MVYKGNCQRLNKDLSFYYSLTSLCIIISLLFLFILYLIHGYKPMGMPALCREVVWIQHSGLHICIQKSVTRLGLVCFSFKEVRSYFRKVSGVVEMCGCGRSGLGMHLA